MAVNAKTVGGHHVRVDLDGDGQPGYLATAKMLGEAGMLLAEDGASPERSGFLTPAAALGTDSLDRFRYAGVRIQVPRKRHHPARRLVQSRVKSRRR